MKFFDVFVAIFLFFAVCTSLECYIGSSPDSTIDVTYYGVCSLNVTEACYIWVIGNSASYDCFPGDACEELKKNGESINCCYTNLCNRKPSNLVRSPSISENTMRCGSSASSLSIFSPFLIFTMVLPWF